MTTPDWFRARLAEAAEDFAAVLRRGPLEARVPTCPEWTLVDLAGHLGWVHDWAAEVVRTGSEQPQNYDRPPEGSDPADWYREKADRLLAALAETSPERACWNFGPGPQVVAFWARRQAHEATMHRVDAQLSVGEAEPYGARLAADGVGEVFEVMMPRRVRVLGRRPDLDGPLLVSSTEPDASWLLSPSATGEPLVSSGGTAEGAAAVLAGPAEKLLAVLWKRRELDKARVRVDGDAELARRFLASTLTP